MEKTYSILVSIVIALLLSLALPVFFIVDWPMLGLSLILGATSGFMNHEERLSRYMGTGVIFGLLYGFILAISNELYMVNITPKPFDTNTALMNGSALSFCFFIGYLISYAIKAALSLKQRKA